MRKKQWLPLKQASQNKDGKRETLYKENPFALGGTGFLIFA
jgi:hypothetical protein